MTMPIVLEGLLTNPAMAAGLTWEPFRSGIEAAWLYRSGPEGPAAAVLRYQPGAAAPLHQHRGWEEHIFVLSGRQVDQHASYPAGSFIANPPGSRHSVTCPDGCLALLVWERTPMFVEEETGLR